MDTTFAISGPTGSGKTDFAFQLAKDLNLSVVNADPFQFYRELPIIGNQPPLLEVSTEWIHFQTIAEPLTAGDFSRMSLDRLSKPGIWVGTGMYLGAALYGLDSDRRKGAPFQGNPRVRYKMIILDPPREELYEKLNLRVDAMLKAGAMEEAKRILALLEDGKIKANNPVLKAIGLKHLLMHLAQNVSLEEVISLWKRDTRRLAKRQWTWLRKFSAPAKNRLWLTKPTLRQAKEFFYSA